MNNFQRLQGAMPFAVMLYLMMTLAQLHGAQVLWRSTISAPPSSFALTASLSGLTDEMRHAVKTGGHVVLPGEQIPYKIGGFVPP